MSLTSVVLLILAAVLSFGIGLVVLARDYRKIENIAFAGISLGIVGWSAGIAGFISTHNLGHALIWAKFYYFAPILLVFSSVIFAQRFLSHVSIGKWLNIFVSLTGVVLTLFLVSQKTFITQSLVRRTYGTQVILNGHQYALYSAYLLICFVLTIGLVLHKASVTKRPNERLQATTFILGYSASCILGVFFNLILPGLGNYSLIVIGPVLTTIFLVSVAYAIVRHRLFDIRAVIARTLGYAFSLAVLSAIYGFIVFGIASVVFHLHFAVVTQVFLSIATGIAALSFQRLKRFFDKTTNRIFYRDAYDPQELFGQLNRMLVSSLDTKYLMMQSISIIETFLKPDFAVIGLRDGDGQRMFMSRKLGFSAEDILRARHLTPHYHHKVIIADYLEGKKYAELRELMLANNVAVIVRLAQNLRDPEGGLGYLVLGNKKSGNPYTEQDIRVLDTVANELIIAIQNALHFEEIQNFNATLQAQVDEATRKLRRTNEKLKALDETKDDFISMASHQLRTPLTSVKGYLSMVLEGDAGKVNATQAKMLGQAFISSQRMVYLIADLLNVSRLRTGKFVIEQHPTNLATMIEEELAQLTETAAARELKLTYDKPKDFPDLMLDETKTRQVIMNFVDNAIYYTPAGGNIKVQLAAQDDAIELRVTDDGIGVPKSEQHHLFTKFYRARNAQKARPDGTGLGLFMAKKVIVGQGGSIIFESAEGQGSTFGFRFSRRKLATNLPQADLSSGQSTTVPAERTQKQPA